VAVLRVETGKFGFTDMYGAKMQATQRLACELTVRNGKVVYDLNGISRPDWTTLPKDYLNTGDARWDAITPLRRPGTRPAATKQ
jgi:dihydroorotase